MIGALASLGHNIDSRDQCNFRAIGDLTRTDPLLAPPADNGGPVATAALKPGSPAIDAGAPDVCPSTDARGALRHAGGGCDIGAFEVANRAPPPLGELARDKLCRAERRRLQPRPRARNGVLPVRHDDRLRQQHRRPSRSAPTTARLL